MVLRLDLRVDPLDAAIRADEIRDPLWPIGLRGVVRVVGLADGLVDVGDELVRVAEFLGEGAVRIGRIEAGAKDDSIAGIEIADSITESVAFDRSTRGIGRGIPPEQDVLAGEVRQLHARAIVRRQVEIGSEIAFLQHAAIVSGIATPRRASRRIRCARSRP